MNELILELEEITPKEFFGAQNAHIELLKTYYPKLKIVARGNTIKAYGDEELLEEFDKRMMMLMAHFDKYNKLDENAIERILTSNSSLDYATSAKSGDLYDISGRLVRTQKIDYKNKRFSLEGLQSGVYVLKLSGPTASIKIVKQ